MLEPVGSAGVADRPPVPAARRGRRRVAGWILIGAGVLVLLWLGWIAFSGSRAAAELASARTAAQQLKAGLAGGDAAVTTAAATDFRDHADRARRWVSGPVWAVTAALPGAGPIATVHDVGRTAGDLADNAVSPLLAARDALSGGGLRRADGSLDASRIAAVATGLQQARATVDTARAQVAATPATTWVHAVDRARTAYLTELDQLSAPLDSAADAAGIAAPMLGATGTRRYFVAFQNEAEARGTGGLAGQFAILTLTDGRPVFTHFGTDAELDGVAADVALSPDSALLYAPYQPTRTYLNANVGPDFPTAARLWTSMWTKRSGERLDGAFSLDPTALSYLLAVTGPATLTDGSTVGADSVVAVTERDAYAKFGNDRAARQLYLAQVARAVVTRLFSYHGSTSALLDAGRRAVAERRIAMWSADPTLQARIAPSGVSGELPAAAAPIAAFTVVNDTGSKLDYYLERHLSWRMAACTDPRAATATLTLRNTAPAGLPNSVTDRFDAPPYRVAAGDNRLEVFFFAPAGATLGPVRVDGREVPATYGADQGHPAVVIDLELPRAATRSVEVDVRQPVTAGTPALLAQPLVQPATIDPAGTGCH